MGKRPTQEDVAKLAGTSTAVVSYVLNNGPRPISEDARQRVLAAIAQTGYRTNKVARALAHGQSSVFGLIVPDLANPFLAQLTQAFEREFFRRGYSLLIGDSEDDLEREISMIETLMGQQLTGLVWYGVEQPIPLEIMELASLPVALIGNSAGREIARDGGRFIWVDMDDRGHASLATTHLVEHGRTRIAHLGGPTRKLNARERALGWSDALREAGLTPAGRCTAPFTREGGFESVPELMETSCDAIVASNEMQAVGLLAGLAKAGVRVPDEVALVAVNGTGVAEFTVPALTTVSVSLERLSRDIAQALLPQSTASLVETEGRLALRDSCGCKASVKGELL